MKNYIFALYISFFCLIKTVKAVPSLNSFTISPASIFYDNALHISESTQTSINFSFVIARPMIGSSFENENLKVRLEYESPQGTITALSSEYTFSSSDFLSGGGSTLTKSYTAAIPPNSIGGKVYLKVLYNTNTTPTRLPSAFYYTKKGANLNYHNYKFVKSINSGKLYIQLPFGLQSGGKGFYHIFSHETFTKLFYESAVSNHTITIQDEPLPHSSGGILLDFPYYFDGTYDGLLKTFLPLSTFLAKDTHTPGDQKVYLVQADRFPNRYHCYLISAQALSNYHFNTKNIKSIDMNVRDGNIGSGFKYFHEPGTDFIE